MHNHVDKYPARPGFEPGTSRLQAPVDTNEPSGPARWPLEKGIPKLCSPCILLVYFSDGHDF